MKTKYLFLSMICIILSSGLVSCGSDSEDSFQMPQKPEAAELVLGEDTVTVGVGETATVNINDGGGDYKVINENPAIVTGRVEGNVITITSLTRGLTGVVVSDADGNYKRLVVRSMYQEIAFDTDELGLSTKIGHAVTARVRITKGNGLYTTVSDNPDVATVTTIIGDSIAVVSGRKSGTANIEFTDVMGLKKTLVVNVETTEEPYTAAEKEAIKAITVQCFQWDGVYRTSSSIYKLISEKTGDTYKYGWEYTIGTRKYYWVYLTFTDDLTVGQKANGTVEAKPSWGATLAEYTDVKVEILKNDGTNIWAVISVVKDDYLHYGYFCLPVK